MRRSISRFAVLVLLSSLGGVALAQTSPAPQSKLAASSATPAANPPGYAGADTCAICHQDEVKAFPNDPHSRLALEHSGKGVTCESCHGPGQAHVESGGVANKIFQFTKATPKQVEAKCLACHVGDHPNFERTAHGEALVSCTSCHSIHKFEAQTPLLRKSQPGLCYQCHTDIKAAFAQPFHHRVDEGLMKCTDCHDPHGTFQPNLLRISATQDEICTKCHIENAGPFVYEHPPIKTEGCTSCHFPHGSSNPRLLIRNNLNSMCLQCHSPSMNFTAPGTPSFHNQANQYQACTVCHVQIHGSNASFYFFK
ncbi:MAG: DmsE family decaheme c-type cytochrome [Silvibacterium sp.]